MMYTKNDLVWDFFSIYYARNDWGKIVDKLTEIKKKLTNKYVDFVISFSEEKGENLRVAVSYLPVNRMKVRYTLEDLNKFIKTTPSELSHSFPYGKTLWKNHENNTIVWNTFMRMEPYEEFSSFEKASSNLLLELLQRDYSSDNFLTAGLYFHVKILKQFQNHQNQITGIMLEAIDSLSKKFENYGLQSIIDDIILEFQIDENSIFITLDDFWNELNGSPLYQEWILCTDILIDHQADFKYMGRTILEYLGLGRSHNMLILVLVYRWITSRHCELNISI